MHIIYCPLFIRAWNEGYPKVPEYFTLLEMDLTSHMMMITFQALLFTIINIIWTRFPPNCQSQCIEVLTIDMKICMAFRILLTQPQTELFDSLGCCWGREKTVWREGVLLKYGPGEDPQDLLEDYAVMYNWRTGGVSDTAREWPASGGNWWDVAEAQLRLERRRTPALTHRPTSGPGTARQPPILRSEHWGALTILTLMYILFTIHWISEYTFREGLY